MVNVAIARQDETQHRPRSFFVRWPQQKKTEKKGGGIELHKAKKDIALLRKPGRVRLWRVAPPPCPPGQNERETRHKVSRKNVKRKEDRGKGKGKKDTEKTKKGKAENRKKRRGSREVLS